MTSVTPPGELTAGSEFDATTRVLGRDWSWRLRITSVSTNDQLGYEVVDGLVDIQVDYELKSSDDGCLFTLTGRSRPKNLLTRLVDRAGAWQLKREMNTHVENLKRILETTGL